MTKINYKDDALRQFVEKCGIVRTHLARLFNQTNNLTVDRWLSGKDIYLGSLLTICNTYRLDLLSFMLHDNKPFATTVEDIALMEDAGLNLRDIMKEHGVELAQPGCYSLQADAPMPSLAAMAAQPETPAPAPEPTITNMPSDMIDKIILVQTRAYEHEQQSLKRQRADLQNIIERQDAEIAELKKELRKQRQSSVVPYPINSSRTIVVNDSTSMKYNDESEENK